DARRTFVMVRAWSSCVPWLKFSRAQSIPAATSFPSVGSSRDAGPIVQMIFALRMDAGAYGHGSAPARLQRLWTCAAEWHACPIGLRYRGRPESEVEIAFGGF